MQLMKSIDVSSMTAGPDATQMNISRINNQTIHNSNLHNTVLSTKLSRQAIKHGNFYSAGHPASNLPAPSLLNDKSGSHPAKKKKKKKKKVLSKKDINFKNSEEFD